MQIPSLKDQLEIQRKIKRRPGPYTETGGSSDLGSLAVTWKGRTEGESEGQKTTQTFTSTPRRVGPVWESSPTRPWTYNRKSALEKETPVRLIKSATIREQLHTLHMESPN